MKIGYLGFGEAGNAFVQGLNSLNKNFEFYFYDKKLDEKINQEAIQTKQTIVSKSKKFNAIPCQCVEELCQKTQIIFSLVTADQSLVAAQNIAVFLTEKHYFLDCNSVSPNTKKQANQAINKAHYLDVAVMAPVYPKMHKTPLLISGKQNQNILSLLDAMELNYQWAGEEVGKASVTKMLRSILIKGMESLITECVTAAEFLNLDDEILISAGKTLKIDNMPELADYMMERVAVHGKRRAAELREVAKTLKELGFSNFMATAIAKQQDFIADMKISEKFANNKPPQDRKQLAKIIQSKQL